MKCIGYVAMVRSLEITHGQNGFYLYMYEVQFYCENLGEDDARWLCHKLVEAWCVACEKMGFFKPGDDELAFYRRVFDFRLYFIVGDYLVKQDDSKAWILAHEIAKLSSKFGRRAGVHPFQFATRGHFGDFVFFIEYARATKGKRKLMFSPGLKVKAGLHDVSDEQIAAQEIDSVVHFVNFFLVVWDFVKATDRQHNTCAALLDAAERDGKTGMA